MTDDNTIKITNTKQQPDLLAYHVGRDIGGGLVWSLVGVGWFNDDNTIDIQFSTAPVAGLVKLKPYKA